MNLKRFGYNGEPVENYLFAITLNNTAIIDLNYLKMIGQTVVSSFSGIRFLEFNFNETMPTNCSFRVFAKNSL